MVFFFKTASHELFARGWLQTMILLISASPVARITDVSYWHPAGKKKCIFFLFEAGSHYVAQAGLELSTQCYCLASQLGLLM
jgi:hypothetical protein